MNNRDKEIWLENHGTIVHYPPLTFNDGEMSSRWHSHGGCMVGARGRPCQVASILYDRVKETLYKMCLQGGSQHWSWQNPWIS